MTAEAAPKGRGRLVGFGLLAFVAVATCIRLGIWQLDRLEERRAYNARVAARLAEAPIPVAAAIADAGEEARWRRVRLRGRADYASDVAVAARTHRGSPGVWLVTPVAREGTDTLVALVRGWVYSPDGRTVAFPDWRDDAVVDVEGRLEAFHTPRRGAPRLESAPRAFRWLERDTLAAQWGRPVAPYLVHQHPVVPADTLGGFAGGAEARPARLPIPALDEGPHLSYALQWFGFATVFAVGFGAVVWRRTRSASA